MRERHVFAGAMIRPLCDKGIEQRCPFVSATFTAPANPKQAQLFISALGLYRAFINGKRVGDDQLTPGWTCYRERLAYQTYDVASLLQPGENTIDIWLADGWLRWQMMWAKNPIFNTWGSEIGAIAELVCDGAILPPPAPPGGAACCRSSNPASISAKSTTPGWRPQRQRRRRADQEL